VRHDDSGLETQRRKNIRDSGLLSVRQHDLHLSGNGELATYFSDPPLGPLMKQSFAILKFSAAYLHIGGSASGRTFFGLKLDAQAMLDRIWFNCRLDLDVMLVFIVE